MGNARSVIKRLRVPLDIMLLCVRWYVAYALGLRNLGFGAQWNGKGI
jgi:transposase-like protein